MNSEKVKLFLELAGQGFSDKFIEDSPAKRELGAQLLLSEVLEYVIKGLGVTPSFNGVEITDADALRYESKREVNKVEMLDGLADVAYTMYWNSLTFGAPLEEAFDLVCDNNLEKFVKLDSWSNGACVVEQNNWHLGCDVAWPKDVVKVEVISVAGDFYGVGKDERSKVRKPCHFKSVDLSPLV